MSQTAIDARLVYYRRESGIGQYIVHLTQLLPQIDAKRDYVILQSRKDQSDLNTAPNARRVNLWTPSHNRFEQLVLPIELSRVRFDLLHSPDFIPPFRGHYRRVITVHDLTFLRYPQFLTVESRRYYNVQIQRAVTVADHILADSYATQTDLVELLNVPVEKISVVWLAPDSRFQPGAIDTVRPQLDRLGLPSSYMLFVGTFEPRKNVDGLLQAYRILLEREPSAPKLVIAGRRGWLFDETLERIEQLNLREHITILDNPHDSDLVALYRGAAVFILPSYYEGFGLPVLEAMSCGIPVIISDRGSLPEIAGDAALAVDPDDVDALADRLEQVLCDSELRQSLIHKGLERASEFTWERCAHETLDVYRMVLNEI